MPVGGEFRVNVTIAGDQKLPDVAALESGGFVVTCETVSSTGGPAVVVSRIFDAEGGPTTGEIVLSDGAAASEAGLSVIGTADGGFVASWVSNGVDGDGEGIAARVVELDALDQILSDSGTITFDDLDISDLHTVSVAGDSGNTLGGVLSATVSNTAADAGEVSWIYEIENTDIVHLAEGEMSSEAFIVTIDDGHGGVVAQTVVVTIEGHDTGAIIAFI